MNQRQKIESVLTQLEAQATQWAYAKIEPIPLIADYIEGKTQDLVVTYYKKYAAGQIVSEICTQIRAVLKEKDEV